MLQGRLTRCVIYDAMGESGSQVVPQPPRCSLTLHFWGCVCIGRPLTSAPGTCVWSLPPSLMRQPGARTSDAHKQTQRDEEKRRVSPPGSSWPATPTLTSFTRAKKMMNCPCRAVFVCTTPAQQRTTAATSTGVCVHAFEYTHKVVSEAHF